MDKILARLAETFDTDKLADIIAEFLPGLIAGLAVFLLFLIAWWLLRVSLGFVMRKAGVDKTVVSFVLTVTRYTVFTVATLTALAQVGIDTASILASLGVVGLTIGFAAKDALSNILSGLFIFWDRPFTVDDLVEIGGNYGRVEAITLRSTRIVTPDGKMLAFPNTMVVNNVVTSYTNFPHLRLDVEVTIAVTEDIERARGVLLSMVEARPEYMKAPAPAVVVKALNDYNVLLEVRVWIEEERDHVARRFALRQQVFETLNAANVQMPYETIQLAPFEVRSSSVGA